MYYAHATAVGTIARDPLLRKTPKGTPVANFSVAIVKTFQSGEDERTYTSYIPVSAFGKNAELVERFGKKGIHVLVSGTLTQESWTDKEGNKNTKLKIDADVVRFFERNEDPSTDQTQDEVPF